MSDSLIKTQVIDNKNESEMCKLASTGAVPKKPKISIEGKPSKLETKPLNRHLSGRCPLKNSDESKAGLKMSVDSLDVVSSHESPNGAKKPLLNSPDTDSCLSVSPSPDPDSKKKIFDFSMIDPSDKSSLTASLQTEQEFLDFMFSLPQIQKEAVDKDSKEKTTKKVTIKSHEVKNVKTEKKASTKSAHSSGNPSSAGFDHLDNLCRMMEQLGELKEQNTRLHRRVLYLEELKTLQEMHRDIQNSIASRKSALSLGSVSLSDSDLRLEDLTKCGYLLDSEDSLDQNASVAKNKDQRLGLPETSLTLQRHSSPEDERRGKEDTRRTSEKEKKGHKSAWGKVKHMISYNTKRENVRKKSTAGVENSQQNKNTSIIKSLSTTSAKNHHSGGATEGVGVSDPEEYDLEYESMDPDGTSWDWDDAETGGIWMGPKTTPESAGGHTDPSGLSRTGENIRAIKRNKPQLTITVPSNENLHSASRTANAKLSADLKCSPGSSPSKFDLKSSPEFSTSPPSPRRSSNWSKVKNAFLTGPIYNHHNHNSHNADQELQIGNRSRSHQSPANRQFSPQRSVSSQPPSPNKKANQLQTNFSFDVTCTQEESDSPSGISPEISPDDILLPNRHRHSKDRRRVEASVRHSSVPSAVVHKNLIDLQRTLTGEFNKKLQEWEKLKSQQGIYGSENRGIDIFKVNQAGTGDLPQDFKKKLHEWEKMKGREKFSRPSDTSRIHVNAPLLHLYHHHNHQNHNHHHQNIGHEDLKTKIHDEDDLPPDFKKKLAEWEIRKALVGKGQQNVEQLQKNLGEEFNKKLAEWEKMKASSHGKISSQGTEPSVAVTTESSSVNNIVSQRESRLTKTRTRDRTSADENSIIGLRENISSGSILSYMPVGPSGYASQSLDRKGSGHKIKKSKSGKVEKTPMTKAESQKHRDKELLWLEKELHKIEREKQRLEREKEKFMEREARLEKMRHAMRQGPAEKKEIYIKTSTGEFRFEGISQTFTKKLYEWEERRGIRPESSTFVLLDPNYKAPEKEKETSTKNSPELKRITRSRSESSVVEMNQSSGTQATVSHQSSISLNDIDKEEGALQDDNKASSEPTLSADEEVETPKCAVLVQMEEELVEESDSQVVKNETEGEVDPNYQDPYAPAEITRLIDSSGSEDNLKSQNDMDDVTVVSNDGIIMTTPVTFVSADDENLRLEDSQRSEESYRSLLHENMTLLGRLKEQESLCRALETQMGDIDTKMDNVADQHLKTLEKLHRHVSIMKKTESSSKASNDEIEGNSSDDVESNERLILQLKARIAELELKGDKLMEEKEELERAFKLHKSHETEIAESLLIRIRELQDAGAEVNIQTVQSQTDNTSNIIPTGSEENLNDHSSVTCHEDEETETNDASAQTTASTTSTTENPLQSSPSTASDATSQTTASLSTPVPANSVKKKKRKRRDEYCNSSDEDVSEDDDNETDEEEEEEEEEDNKRRSDKEGKDHQKRKRKLASKKVQKLHSLTADLLFQAKRLEGALISRHNLPNSFSDRGEIPYSKQPKKRSLKGRSSLRLTGEENKIHIVRKPSKGANSNRTWSSIEAITSPDKEAEGDGQNSYESRAAALASESQDLLAMNAELSRMAKELRKEMLSVWSFRESTSPESNSSDTREETIKSMTKINDSDSKYDEVNLHEEEKDDENEWLKSEAREILDNIATLLPASSDFTGSPDNDGKDEADSGEEKKELETSSDSEKEDSTMEPEIESADTCEIQQSIVESEEHFQSWWDVPFPKKRNKFAQEKSKGHSKDVQDTDVEGVDHEHAESADLDSVIPGSSGTRLSDLLRMEKEKKDCFIEDKETLNIRLSPYYNINSPRISRASSSTSDDERKDVTGKCFFTAEKEDFESANGTLNTNCSSTVKSDVLSSSFEYETKDAQTKNVNEHDEHECRDDFYKEQYEKSEEVHAINRNADFTPSQLSKVQEIVKETRMKLENSKELKPKEIFIQEYDDKLSSCNEEKKFETEVKSGYKTDGKIGGLRTRRVSDSQIFYMENQEGLLDETYGYQNETSIYVDKHYKPATRTPSIRRNQSESDVLWLKEHEDIDNYDNDPSHDIFVPTHRTIFTVSGTNDSCATEVIPTFLPDEDENEGEDEVCEGTEKSLEYTDKDLSCETLKEDMSLSNDINSESSQPCESKSKRNYQNENDDFDNELSDTQAKIFNENRNLSTSSRSITPFRSPPVSPSFINAFCSSFHQNSPPVKSKKRVLEAANETSPTVKTMIDLYNKRITEKQEMLINPFKPGDPYTENKYSNINATNKTDSYDESDLNKGRVLKSQSTSILPTYSTKNCWNIQRSISGTDEVLHSNKFYDFESGLPKKTSSPLSFKNSHVNIYGKDAIGDLNASTEDSLDTGSENRVSSSSFNVESENARTRSSKLRKARNDFLSRGVAPLTSINRLRDNYDDFSEGINKDNIKNCKKVNNCLSNINISSSAVDSISESLCKDSLNVELRHLPVLRKESFRRQSESCLLDEFSLKSDVLKSASASGIEYRSNQIKGRPPSNKENRKSSYDPTDDKRSTKGIFKLFKKSKSRDRKDLTTVQELCKQSLAAVEITSPNRISETSNLEQPSTSYSQNPEALNKVPERVRASKTLPREEAPNEASASTSRSCPSSPVALRKSKTSQWLSVGKNIFKSRSSSPNKRPR